ncbi:hypothetical protein BABA_15367 [Neobacillus bataviensis LMG 21833]|uniref:DUF3949 domain-containing protein n=1 Tax=Neobacillus bataviensis LMG 21833 TaxID=1117379 RepID=K6E050_9BACI|nr:DUF3949 domain-containing protein [Neobacillus bataviensis]EKN66501.1 hypothetical protein BABA_15367 [Neobacillus bataviensis LMG 21833]
MGLSVTLWALGGYILLSLILLPFQYSYIKELKKMDKKRRAQGISQDEMYDNMSFEEQQLSFNAQGNVLFIGANLFATLLYTLKSKK